MALSESDLPAIYSFLTNSLSGDENVRKPAEEALAQCDAKHLANQVDVRLMASLYFKNSINRYWRKRRDSSGISNEEKVHLRQKLVSHLREENYQIALTLAVLISKIARIDYPIEWPDLFSVLAEQLRSADALSSHRIFLILFRTLKELSTKRLIDGQRTFAQISSHFFDYSWQLWQCDVQTILHGFSTLSQSSNALEHQEELYLICERWLLCLKIIRQLIISGYPSDAKSVQEVRPVKEVSPVILNAVLIKIQETHPFSFSDKSVLPLVMVFCLNKITDPEPDALSFEQFLIQCMVMVKSVLECKEYKRSLIGRVVEENGVTLEQMKKNISNAVNGVLTSLMPSDRILLLCNVLIRRYFVLTPHDLEELYNNPESFHHEQDMIQWTEKLRPCAEALYIVLFHNHSELLGPLVVSILQEAMNGCPTSVTEITPGLLLKDAAYAAAAYVYYELSNYMTFKDWFNGALSLDLSNDHPNMRIIHRKVAIVLGQWVSEIKDDTKRPVYYALIKLLQDKDLSVRLAACRSLCLHIEDANFLEGAFIDLLPVCWDSCFKLVEEVQEFDSKVQVLNLISILTGQVKEIIPFANKLVLFFQKFWEESSGESLLQIQLLVALKNFVVALGYQSPCCYNMLLPILQKGIDINNPDELNLLEDSMQLWEATLCYAPSMVPQLLACFPCLVDIIERSFDHLQVSVNIIEDYIILGGMEFLSMHAASIAKLLDLVVGNVNDKGLLSILPKLIVICLSGGDEYDPSKTAVKASSAAILARILVTNTNYLGQLTAEPSLSLLLHNSGVSTEENVLFGLVDIWLDKVDNVSAIQRKTYGLALSTFLKLGLPKILEKLDLILSVCTSVILGCNEDTTEEESSNSGDNMGSSRPHGEGTIPNKEFRRRQIKNSDPIYQLSLEASVRENLQTCAAQYGESFNSAISSMHPAALAQLKQALKMP
ncbi:hypothetical protein F8388_023308 [Cannabis sativa]|uniref:Importin N-terminal domain-containing protein n=1 Tax=Cannabis sativa TaxID=3483 RepID=A0A7J6DS63_CANSA|nr:hypothetical protein G4B88_002678 [Cannabis sativa]KAF4349009.1 hypothetical protein G4B88_012749 [Cannabis sativa]KAF4389057.1 hypothetical protein F8388_026786 [Cannabis sativa]KAF4393504.1 hypothetical protein F8388_023308 [Cannabis sativa]